MKLPISRSFRKEVNKDNLWSKVGYWLRERRESSKRRNMPRKEKGGSGGSMMVDNGSKVVSESRSCTSHLFLVVIVSFS
jgi:hypothetical protein